MLYCKLPRGLSQSLLLAIALIILLGSIASTEASLYYFLTMEPRTTVTSPPVILQGGTAGTSTTYANSTSAKVEGEAVLFDYVDNNEYDVDTSTDKGMHSGFPAQQAGPDSTYDTLSEENAEAIEDYVDNNSSDMDSSSDLGTHGNFENQKAQDSSYDTLTEASQGNTYSLDATGGYMIIGDGTPDWGSTTGTISFWVQMDGSVQGRFYGQDGNMETRWSGTNLILDWGGTGSMTSAYSFSADIWYFVAIVWDENNDNLFLYIGDENNAPTLDANSISGTWTSTTPVPTENRFLNGLGGAEPVDGHGDDLRYWNIARSLAELQSDYNETLSGSETNLRSYFKLENSFDDIGPNDDDGSGSGSYSFATDVPFSGSGDYSLDLEVQWTNVIDFLVTEKLCIYTGTLGSESLRVDYWNGTGWENLAADLTAFSCNEYSVSLTSTNFTVRFKGGNETGDPAQDQWQIDASLLRVEGAGDKEDAVDNDTSDEDSSSDLGVLTDFTNMTAYDANMANLTETTAGGADGDWGDTNNPGGTLAAQSTARAMGGTSPDVDNMTLTSISVWWGGTGTGRLAVYQGGAPDNPTGATLVWDAGEVAIPATAGWVTISGGSASLAKNEVTWIAWKCDDADYYYETSWDSASDFQSARGRAVLTAEGADSTDVWDATIGTYTFGDWWYDMYINYTVPNYQLDQEVQWTDVPYLLPNENLSIYGGTMGGEDIKVEVWNGTGWEAVFTDLSSGWNNASVTDWLTTSNFTIRFKGGIEAGDTSEDTWQIDVALIHLWHGDESFELDLEVQWTNAEFTRINEELCIRTGTFSGSENIQVKVWNSTGSSWHWVMNLTASQWNNVSISSYLTSSTFTVQFLGGTETDDTTQDSWNIDATLLHIWTNESTWLSGWNNRVKLTINHNDIESDLSDFPILVYLSNASGYKSDDVTLIFDEVGANSKKIAVTESDGTTQCYVEIEKWNSTSEQAWLWVKGSTINRTAYTDLYLYYDNSQSDNTAYVGDKASTPAQTVWNTNFKAIWHLDEDPSGGAPQMKDSTSNNHNGTSYGTMTTGDQVAGKIDGSLDFDGSDDYIQTTSNELQTLDNFTLSVWFKADSTTAPQHILWQGPASQNGWGDGTGSSTSHEMHLTICKFDTNNTLNFFYGYEETGSNFTPAVEIIAPFSDTTNWNHAVVVMTGASTSPSAELFLNGVSQGTDTGTQTNRTAWDTNLRLGRPGPSQRYFDGRIDEVRILDISRSDAWIKASYESGRDNLLDFGASGTSEGTYNYVLRVNNTVANPWQIRLKGYSDSNIGRLQNCTIYFQNSSDGPSRQIYLQNGLYVNQTGPWYDLGDSETIYLVMKLEASSIGTSHIYTYLEIRTPSTTTYAQYIITFEFT